MIILIVQCVKSLTSTTPSPPWVTAWLWVVALGWTTLLNFFAYPVSLSECPVIWRVQRWAGSFKRHNEHKLAKLQQQRFGVLNLFSFWNRVSFPFLSSHWFHFQFWVTKSLLCGMRNISSDSQIQNTAYNSSWTRFFQARLSRCFQQKTRLFQITTSTTNKPNICFARRSSKQMSRSNTSGFPKTPSPKPPENRSMAVAKPMCLCRTSATQTPLLSLSTFFSPVNTWAGQASTYHNLTTCYVLIKCQSKAIRIRLRESLNHCASPSAQPPPLPYGAKLARFTTWHKQNLTAVSRGYRPSVRDNAQPYRIYEKHRTPHKQTIDGKNESPVTSTCRQKTTRHR